MSGPGRIPVSEVVAWADVHQMSRTSALELLFYIDEMDRAYMAYLQERREEEEGKRPKNQTPPAPTKPTPTTARKR